MTTDILTVNAIKEGESPAEYLARLLNETGSVETTASILGVKRNSVYVWMYKYNVTARKVYSAPIAQKGQD